MLFEFLCLVDMLTFDSAYDASKIPRNLKVCLIFVYLSKNIEFYYFLSALLSA